ncbi:MAG: hypothetical protein RLZ04_748 [Actinomycetota bacterium]|jgi:hypothetical protein
MTSRLAALVLGTSLVSATVLGACGGDDASTANPTTTSGLVAVTTTTVAPTTTSSTTTTSTSTTSTTTTIPVPQGLELRADGLGDALFGAAPDDVVAYVEAVLGAPTADSGWVDPVATAIPCTGTAVRFVTWHDLTLQFTDESSLVTGLRHFVSYTYGPAADQTMPDPYGLPTEGGATLGVTLDALREAHSGTEVSPGDDVVGPNFVIEEGLRGFLTGTNGGSLVISFVGGQACGE